MGGREGVWVCVRVCGCGCVGVRRVQGCRCMKRVQRVLPTNNSSLSQVSICMCHGLFPSRQLLLSSTRPLAGHYFAPFLLFLHPPHTHLDDQLHVVREHEGPEGQGVGADGGEQDGGHLRVRHGPASCQAVGGGAGGRGHNEAVSLQTAMNAQG